MRLTAYLLTMALVMVLAPSLQACDAATYLRLLVEQEKARMARPTKLNEKDLLVLHSEGLTGALTLARKMFMREHKGYRVFLESCSSTGETTGTSLPADIIALTDSWPIRELLMPKDADYYVNFARDELVIAYGGEGSNYDQLRDASWKQILHSDTLRFGRTDAQSDDCGVRTLLALTLLEQKEEFKGIKDRLLAQKRVYPSVTKLVGKILHDKVDYAIMYRSVATYHRMLMTKLPKDLSLGDKDEISSYQKASITVEKPGNPPVKLERKAAPITCSFTILRSATHRQAARLFAEFLLSRRGAGVVSQGGLKPIVGGRVAFSRETSIY